MSQAMSVANPAKIMPCRTFIRRPRFLIASWGSRSHSPVSRLLVFQIDLQIPLLPVGLHQRSPDALRVVFYFVVLRLAVQLRIARNDELGFIIVLRLDHPDLFVSLEYVVLIDAKVS